MNRRPRTPVRQTSGPLRPLIAVAASAILILVSCTEDTGAAQGEQRPTPGGGEPVAPAPEESPAGETAGPASPPTEFDVGDRVTLTTCSLVGPPSRDAQASYFRVSCPSLPPDIQFADVTYLDPEFPAGLTTNLRIEGIVGGQVASDIGFTVLVLQAESVSQQ